MTGLDFDHLLDAGRLWAALGEATGRGVVVAILDTGVDVHHPDLKGAVIRSVEVVTRPQVRVQDLPVASLSPRQLDPVGHGTACAGIIHQLAPEAKLISVRVIGAGAAGTGEQFVRGLQWVLEQREPRIPVANLSLGTMQERFAGPLRRLVDQAYVNDVVLVAAANNMGAVSYPSQFASLIAVDNQGTPDPLAFQFQRGRPSEVVARGIYVKAPTTGGSYQLWTGTSFACPHVSALVARLLSLNPRLTPFQVKTLLHVLRANRTPAAEGPEPPAPAAPGGGPS
jgi:subtilisin family serine protease